MHLKSSVCVFQRNYPFVGWSSSIVGAIMATICTDHDNGEWYCVALCLRSRMVFSREMPKGHNTLQYDFSGFDPCVKLKHKVQWEHWYSSITLVAVVCTSLFFLCYKKIVVKRVVNCRSSPLDPRT
uniref:Uncharacterized protein n=1 Tax=Anopheles atroparvus TaxID=41427 RepID=A0A182J063_ANOAO